MELPISGAQLAELRRLAYHHTIVDTAKAIAAAGIPADLVPIKVAARLCHVTITSIRKRIRRHDITAYRAGQRVLVSLAQVLAPPAPYIPPSPPAE